MSLAADEKAPAQVRGIASFKLDELKEWLAAGLKTALPEDRRAQFFPAHQDIERFEENPAQFHIPAPAPPPAGDPIGAGGWE